MDQSNQGASPALWTRRNVMSAGVAGFSLSLLAACSASGGVSPSSKTSGDWNMMAWDSEADFAKFRVVLDKFFKSYPDMKPHYNYGTPFSDYFTKLQVALAGGSPVDMCEMHITQSPLFASQGLLKPLDEYIAKKPPAGWPDAFYKSAVEAFTFDGSVYGLPIGWATTGMYVNTDWFAAAGVELPDETWTWDDLLAAAKTLQVFGGEDKFGIAMQVRSHDLYPIVKSYGGEYVTAGTPMEAHLTDEGTVAAFEYLYKAMWKDKVMPNPAQVNALSSGQGDPTPFFTGGLAPILINLNDAVQSLIGLIGDKFKWTAAPTPKGPKGRVQLAGGSSWAMPITTARPDVGYKAIEYMVNPANSKYISEQAGTISARTDLYQSAIPTSGIDPAAFKRTFIDVDDDLAHPFYFPQYGRWNTEVFNKNLDLLWTNSTSDVSAVLKTMQTETAPLIK